VALAISHVVKVYVQRLTVNMILLHEGQKAQKPPPMTDQFVRLLDKKNDFSSGFDPSGHRTSFCGVIVVAPRWRFVVFVTKNTVQDA